MDLRANHPPATDDGFAFFDTPPAAGALPLVDRPFFEAFRLWQAVHRVSTTAKEAGDAVDHFADTLSYLCLRLARRVENASTVSTLADACRLRVQLTMSDDIQSVTSSHIRRALWRLVRSHPFPRAVDWRPAGLQRAGRRRRPDGVMGPLVLHVDGVRRPATDAEYRGYLLEQPLRIPGTAPGDLMRLFTLPEGETLALWAAWHVARRQGPEQAAIATKVLRAYAETIDWQFWPAIERGVLTPNERRELAVTGVPSAAVAKRLNAGTKRNADRCAKRRAAWEAAQAEERRLADARQEEKWMTLLREKPVKMFEIGLRSFDYSTETLRNLVDILNKQQPDHPVPERVRAVLAFTDTAA